MTVTKRTHSGISTNFADSEANRTVELTNNDGMDKAFKVGFQINVTRDSGVSYVLTVTVFKSADGGVSYGKLPAFAYSGSGGSYSAADYSITKDITGDDSLWVPVDMQDANAVKVVVESNTASADDAVAIKACSDYNK
jgi:hypothetical protein